MIDLKEYKYCQVCGLMLSPEWKKYCRKCQLERKQYFRRLYYVKNQWSLVPLHDKEIHEWKMYKMFKEILDNPGLIPKNIKVVRNEAKIRKNQRN